jgi:heme/copper-type cytochrome/quinol oxidase subunit 3
MLASLFAACFRPSGPSPRRLRLGSAYWHSMGAIWVVLFAVLYLAG